MSNHVRDEKRLPLSLDFLYNNDLLDMFNMLCVLNEFSNKKNGVFIDELTFYLSIVTSRNYERLIQIFEKKNIETQLTMSSNYYYYEPKIRSLILNANNLELISFITNKDKINYNFKVKISSIGAEKIGKLEGEFLKT
ncbi:hypothetical protein AAHB54_29915 [Bacillus cereus]